MREALRALAQSELLSALLRDVVRHANISVCAGAARLQDAGSQTSLEVSRIIQLSEDNEGAAAGLQQALAASQRHQAALQSELRAAQEAIQLMVPRIHELQLRNGRLYEALGRAHGAMQAAAAQVASAATSAPGDGTTSPLMAGRSLSQLVAGLRDAMAEARRTMAAEEEEGEQEGGAEAEGLSSPMPAGLASGGSTRRRDDASVSPDQAASSPASARRRNSTPSTSGVSSVAGAGAGAGAGALVGAALQRAMSSAVNTPRGATPRAAAAAAAAAAGVEGCCSGVVARAAGLTPRSGMGKLGVAGGGTVAPVPPLSLSKVLASDVPARSLTQAPPQQPALLA
ncbi:hypothetical protein HYH02_007758 [Chlamydomonas schloesseri]|uniref:Uncharacterized protein n=1 Tax=Chlamydomonas schloesseri TaxID=2026947 RepID=A0A835WH48_9CHLO|nr:hypothetical protein HYH02_007758 [Chlamydomonas schloesseri]|eukprot:KAG2447433.1 hypothetical protein HYH02_007758 [Chlamydomonas schloesseri]